jgi:murein L,D-transpeptidase YafK
MVSAAIAATIALPGCQVDGTLPTNTKAMAPLSAKILAEMDQKNMDKEAPILIRVFKQESELEVWKQDRGGRFALLKTYPICRWSGELGPKLREGDRQAPEGFYTITPAQMNPNSQYYLSFDLGYPNAFDRSHGRTGANLMVHGDCSSRGCYSMTDEQVSEIYALGREAFFGGQKSFQVQAYPFRMTPQNFAKHRNNPNMPFWKMLKRGNDHFEVTQLEPKVNVCEKHYVFNAQAPGDPLKPLSFSAAGKCPAYEVPADVAAAVQEKQRRDEFQTAELTRRGTPAAPERTYADGGMHPVFAAVVKNQQAGVTPTTFSLASVPGTIPATVRPPRTPDFVAAPATPDHTAVVTTSALPSERTTRIATSEPASQPPKATSTSGSLFGNLFSSSSKSPSDAKDDGPLDRMAKMIGLRSSDAPPKPPATVEPTKTKVASRPARANGAIRPRSAEAKPVQNVEAEKPAIAAPAAVPPPTVAAAAAAPTSSTIAGAAPALPAGSFESRWSAFR